jgi:predicted transcriptional regulator
MTTEAERPVLESMYNSAYDLPTKDEDVLRSMISILWYVGSSTGCVANRDIQMLVSRGRQSVSSSISRLIKSGSIELVEKSDGSKASCYKVDTTLERTDRELSVLDGAHQEAFRHGGINDSQRKVLDALDTNQTPKRLGEITGLSTSGVYAALGKLRNRGLVSKTGKTWYREKFTTAQINAELDTSDSFIARKSRISTERGKYYNRI